MQRYLKHSLLLLTSTLLFGGYLIHLNVSADSLAIPPFPAYVPIKMFELNPNGSNTGILCTSASKNYGCTKYCTDYEPPTCNDSKRINYPYTDSTINLPIETYYLLNVLTTEMNPGLYNQPAALQAQAIAARSYMGYFLNNPNPGEPYNNSITYQAFVPFAWDSLNPSSAYTPLEPNAENPCLADGLSNLQQLVCNAVSPAYYIAQAENVTIQPEW